jgi:hypothetical protein
MLAISKNEHKNVVASEGIITRRCLESPLNASDIRYGRRLNIGLLWEDRKKFYIYSQHGENIMKKLIIMIKKIIITIASIALLSLCLLIPVAIIPVLKIPAAKRVAAETMARRQQKTVQPIWISESIKTN